MTIEEAVRRATADSVRLHARTVRIEPNAGRRVGRQRRQTVLQSHHADRSVGRSHRPSSVPDRAAAGSRSTTSWSASGSLSRESCNCFGHDTIEVARSGSAAGLLHRRGRPDRHTRRVSRTPIPRSLLTSTRRSLSTSRRFTFAGTRSRYFPSAIARHAESANHLAARARTDGQAGGRTSDFPRASGAGTEHGWPSSSRC